MLDTASRLMDRIFRPGLRRAIVAAVILLGIHGGTSLWAEDAPEHRNFGKLILSLDFFQPANGADDFFNSTQKAMDSLANMGYSSSGSVETKSGFGGRVGYLASINKYIYVGPSAGYIGGPDATATLLVAGGGKSAILTNDRSVGFFRFLVEEQTYIPLDHKFSLMLGGGLGFASGNVTESVLCNGTACIAPGTTTKNSAQWTGFSWEVSPGVAYSNFFLAYRYAGFPSFAGNDNLSAIHWTTSEVVAGFAF